MKIVIDPGHGHYGNPYPPGGYYEGTDVETQHISET